MALDLDELKFEKKEIVENTEGFVSTTNRDALGDNLSKKELGAIIIGLRKHPFIYNEHDVSKAPSGIVHNTQIKKIDESNYGIYAKIGVYDLKVLNNIKNKKLKGFSVSFSSGDKDD